MNAESVNPTRSPTDLRDSLNLSFGRRAAIAALSLAAALLLRLSLDPILKDSSPLVTLYGAVAIAAWYCRWRCAASVSLAGYGLAIYIFSPPGTEITFSLSSLVAFVSYAISCAIIIYTGERMHRAHERLLLVSRARDQVQDSLTREKELLATTLASIGDAVIVTDSEGRVGSLNSEAERLTDWKSSDATSRSRNVRSKRSHGLVCFRSP